MQRATFFDDFREKKKRYRELSLPEWTGNEVRAELGFRGSDYLHADGAAVQIVNYYLSESSDDEPACLFGLVRFTERAESHRGLCHGGTMCAIMDDVIGWMGFCCSGEVKPWSGFTVQVNTSLRKPVPVNSLATVCAHVERREGARKVWINARLLSPLNEVYCEGTGLFLLSPAALESVQSHGTGANDSANRSQTPLSPGSAATAEVFAAAERQADIEAAEVQSQVAAQSTSTSDKS